MPVHISFLNFVYSNFFSETTQTLEVSDDGELVDHEKNNDERENPDNSEIQPFPEGLEDLKEESINTGNVVLLTEPEPVLGDVEETKEAVELNSEEGISVITIALCEEACSSTPQSETDLELDSKQSEEPDTTQESDPPQPEVLPDLVCCSVETEASENAVTIIANDETLELENTEPVVEAQESVLEVNQEEPICEEQNESTVEVELRGHKEQLIQLSECSDEFGNSEESKQERLIGEEPSEGSNQSSSNEEEASDQASQTKSTDDEEKIPSEAELLDQPEKSAETETPELSETKDSKEANQPEELQHTEQENHTNSEQHQNCDKESVQQTEEVSSENVHVADEQQEESTKPVVPKNGNVVDRAEACKLAERLYRLDNVQRTDVVRHLDKE